MSFCDSCQITKTAMQVGIEVQKCMVRYKYHKVGYFLHKHTYKIQSKVG